MAIMVKAETQREEDGERLFFDKLVSEDCAGTRDFLLGLFDHFIPFVRSGELFRVRITVEIM